MLQRCVECRQLHTQNAARLTYTTGWRWVKRHLLFSITITYI